LKYAYFNPDDSQADRRARADGAAHAGPVHLLGAATGTLNFFKSIGGAFGAALFGTVLTAGLHGAAPSAAAFHRVFLLTVPFMVAALVLGLVMREKPLSREMVGIAEGKAEAPEY
jgi:hypothetical protein